MLRAVIDSNVYVSAILSREGPPAQLLRRWRSGEFEIVASEKLLAELERVLAYHRVQSRTSIEERHDLLTLLRRHARLAPDPAAAPQRTRDPADDFVLALAHATRSILVTGDSDLLELSDRYPVWTVARLLEALDVAGA